VTPRALVVLALVWLGLALGATDAAAQRTCNFAVPPSGASIDVPLHPAYATTVDLWEEVKDKASGSLSSAEYEVKFIGGNTLMIRPLRPQATPGNLTFPTKSGVKVVIAVQVVTDMTQACSLVAVSLVTEAEAFQRKLDEEVAKRTAALQAELTALRGELADRVRAGIDQELATRALARRECARTKAVDRNDTDLIVRVGEILYLGDGAVVAFEIQNRRRTITLSSVQLLGPGGRDLAAAVVLEGGPATDGLGRAPGGAITRGTLVVRNVAALRKAPVTLVVTPATGSPVSVSGLAVK